MATRRRKLDLSRLYREPPENLGLASLRQGRLEGLAFRYTIIVPLFSERTGEEVFSLYAHVLDLSELLANRFGGCTLLPVSRGTWLPEGAQSLQADRVLHLYVYARQQNGLVDRFFQYLKISAENVQRRGRNHHRKIGSSSAGGARCIELELCLSLIVGLEFTL